MLQAATKLIISIHPWLIINADIIWVNKVYSKTCKWIYPVFNNICFILDTQYLTISGHVNAKNTITTLVLKIQHKTVILWLVHRHLHNIFSTVFSVWLIKCREWCFRAGFQLSYEQMLIKKSHNWTEWKCVLSVDTESFFHLFFLAESD